MIEKGQIVTVMENVFIDFPGGERKDHFVVKPVRYIATTDSNNNGTFKAKRVGVRTKWLHESDVERRLS